MLPSELVTIRLDVGWHRSERVGMYAAEAFVPTTRELLALEVVPSRIYDGLEHFLAAAQGWQSAVLRDVFDPDPF